MARMKRILLILSMISVCAFSVFFPAPSVAAHAEAAEPSAAAETYAVAATEGVWFYSEANSAKGLFILPFSYYVKVLDDASPFCEVQYLDKTGYCLRSDLLFVDFVPNRPFLRYNYTLSYPLENGSAIGSGAFDSAERDVSFYGTFPFGTQTYYYVYADGIYDYVLKTQEINYDFNTDYLTPTGGEAEGDKPTSAEGGLTGVQIAVICIFCALAVAVAFFVLRGKKPPLPPSDGGTDV